MRARSTFLVLLMPVLAAAALWVVARVDPGVPSVVEPQAPPAASVERASEPALVALARPVPHTATNVEVSSASRASVREALRSGAPIRRDILAQALAQGSPAERAELAHAVAARGDRALVGTVESLLVDPDALVRRAGIETLRVLGGPGARLLLVRAQRDPRFVDGDRRLVKAVLAELRRGDPHGAR